jgi:sugar phosphate isomerase/epimerase
MAKAHPFGLCWGTVNDMSLTDIIVLAGKHGFSSVMFLPRMWDGDVPPDRDLHRMLDDNGITHTTIDGVLSMLPGLPDEVLKLGVPEDRYFRMAESVRAGCFNVPHYCGAPNTSVAAFAECLRPLCERAGAYGMDVGLEFLPGTGIPDLATALRISEAVGHANLGVTVDTWHLARSGGTVAELRAIPSGRIKGFHLSDRAADEHSRPDSEAWGRLFPGAGALPLRDIIAAVLANNPRLAIDVEIFSHELRALPDDDAARQVAAATQALLA